MSLCIKNKGSMAIFFLNGVDTKNSVFDRKKVVFWRKTKEQFPGVYHVLSASMNWLNFGHFFVIQGTISSTS